MAFDRDKFLGKFDGDRATPMKRHCSLLMTHETFSDLEREAYERKLSVSNYLRLIIKMRNVKEFKKNYKFVTIRV